MEHIHRRDGTCDDTSLLLAKFWRDTRAAIELAVRNFDFGAVRELDQDLVSVWLC